jgi:branched-chain amino acid transport system ATP-binding protein
MSGSPLLRLTDVEVVYDRAILVLRRVSLAVPEGSLVALLGANGAGKTTVLKTISGVLGAEGGEISRGSVEFRGERLDRHDPADTVRKGIVHVMEGRRLFEHLTVEENLRSGAYGRNDRRGIRQDLELVYTYFAALRNRRRVKAGYLSGGEQQMVAIGRGLMARPKVMLLDEPSLGLAPRLVRDVFDIVQRLNREEGLTVLVAEQNAKIALEVVQYAYVLENGHVVLEGSAETLRSNDAVRHFYLGYRSRNAAVGQGGPS